MPSRSAKSRFAARRDMFSDSNVAVRAMSGRLIPLYRYDSNPVSEASSIL